MVAELRKQLLAEAEEGVDLVKANGSVGYQTAAHIRGGGWGSTSCAVRRIRPTMRGYLLTRKQSYLDAIATSVDFSFGMNPSEMSWMTGGGSVYPMNPCSMNGRFDKVDEPLPGILIYGPVRSWKNERCVLYPDKTKMGFYRRVVDCGRFIAGCEYTVWETQAPFMFAVACLLPDRPAPAKAVK